MEELNEGRHQVKRKYAQYNRIRVNENGASVRDTIVKYIAKNYVTEEDLYNHLIRLEEDRGGVKVNKAKWFKRNQKFFTTFEKKGTTYYSLSKYGQRVFEMINKRDAIPAEVNESGHMNIPSMAEFIAVNEASESIKDEKLNEGIVEDIRENLIGKPITKIKELYKKYIGADPRKEIASNAKAMITMIATMAAENKVIAKAVLMESINEAKFSENDLVRTKGGIDFGDETFVVIHQKGTKVTVEDDESETRIFKASKLELVESVNEAKVMSKKDIQKLVKDLVADGRHGDDAAFDIADGILYDEEGLEAGIRKHFGIKDPQGWLADRIA